MTLRTISSEVSIQTHVYDMKRKTLSRIDEKNEKMIFVGVRVVVVITLFMFVTK